MERLNHSSSNIDKKNIVHTCKLDQKQLDQYLQDEIKLAVKRIVDAPLTHIPSVTESKTNVNIGYPELSENKTTSVMNKDSKDNKYQEVFQETKFLNLEKNNRDKFLEYNYASLYPADKTNYRKYRIFYLRCVKKLNKGEPLLLFGTNYNISFRYYDSKYQFSYETEQVTDVYRLCYLYMERYYQYSQRWIFVDEDLINTFRDGDNKLWYDTYQISDMLKYHKSSYLASYYSSNHGINTRKFGADGHVYTDRAGLQTILSRGRKPGCKGLMEKLCLDVVEKNQSYEASVLEDIIDYVKEEDIKYRLQYPIGTYRVDMYLPDANIVIEVDEHGHVDRDMTYEKKREKFIRDHVTEKILRINPNVPKFRMAKILGMLARMIKN